MAGQSTAEVRLGAPKVGGYAFAAPLGTARPADATTALNAAYVDLGYVSDDGVEITTENGTTKIKDWNLDTIAAVQDANECSIKITFMQRSVAMAKETYGAANVVTTGTAPNEKITAVHYTGDILPHRQWAFLLKDATGPQVLDIGDGQITNVTGRSFKKNEVIRHEVTIECFKDAQGRFFTHWG